MDVSVLTAGKGRTASRTERPGLRVGANVTESYISQLLTGKKSPPASDRTDIYVRMEKFLKLPKGKISDLADHARREELRKGAWGSRPRPCSKRCAS